MMADGDLIRRAKLATQIAISLIVLFAALYIILSNRYDDSNTKWAFGMVGLVVGYWLK